MPPPRNASQRMMVPPIPWRCSTLIPAFSSERFAISASTYDSVNFLEPTMSGSAKTSVAERKRNATAENKERRFLSRQLKQTAVWPLAPESRRFGERPPFLEALGKFITEQGPVVSWRSAEH